MILHNYHQLNYYQKKQKITKLSKETWSGEEGTNLVHKEKLTKTQEKTFCNLF